MVPLIINEGCAGASVGGDAFARLPFPREDVWGRVSVGGGDKLKRLIKTLGEFLNEYFTSFSLCDRLEM